MALALALLAATCFAAGAVLQQKGALATRAGANDPRFLVQILHAPVWLAGAGLQGAGWVLQGAALDRGPLVLVQAVTALSLVIALPLGVRLTDQHVGRRELLGAIAVVAGIVVFIGAGAPANGDATPSAASWWTAGLLAIALVALCARLARGRNGPALAALFGGAAGVGFALQAAVTKLWVVELGHGVAHLLTQWSTYVLIASALAGFVLQQSALKTGALAAAMASNNAATLVFSVVFGVVVFDERLTRGGGQVAIALAGLAVAVIGVVTLAATSAASADQTQSPSPSLTPS